MKIPTILGLSLLITAISLGFLLYSYQKKIDTNQKQAFDPRNIKVINLTDTQATVIWQTDHPAPGQIDFGQPNRFMKSQNDNRDHAEPKEHLIHFVTLRDLTPNTSYSFHIRSGKHLFPEKPLSFQTAKDLDDRKLPETNKPIRGSVLNVNLNPIDEALILLEIANAQQMATFTSTSGNFVLPLRELRRTDLSSFFPVPENTPATLTIIRGDLSSTVEVVLPLPDNQLLPPLTLGQNVSYKDLIAQSQITPIEIDENQAIINRYDLNKDTTVNSLDLAIVMQYNGRTIDQSSLQELKDSDLNADGVVNQKDIDLLTLNL